MYRLARTIRQLSMQDGDGCLYAVIQWKTDANVLTERKVGEQNCRGESAHYTEDNDTHSFTRKRGSAQKASLTFSVYIFSSNLIILLSALQRTNAEEYVNDITTELLGFAPMHSFVPQRSPRCSLYMTIIQLLRTSLIGETPFAMTSFLTNGRLYPNTVASMIVAHPGSAAGLSGACYVVQFGIGRNKGTRHILLRLVVSRSLGWIGRVVHCWLPASH